MATWLVHEAVIVKSDHLIRQTDLRMVVLVRG